MTYALTGLGVLLLCMFSGFAYADERLMLACDGTSVFDSTMRGSQQIVSHNRYSLIIDLDAKTVLFTGRTFPITKVTDTSIEFRGKADDFDMSGRIDRVSGSASVSSFGEVHGIITNMDFELTCKPGKPLF
jgi:hypothetical protein